AGRLFWRLHSASYQQSPNRSRIPDLFRDKKSGVMDKDIERTFLETMSRALVSLPFDLKVLLEAVSDPDLEREVRELAAATVVHIITPKDGNVEAPLRFSEDVIQLRLALAKVVEKGGESAPAFRARFEEDVSRAEDDLTLFRQALGDDIVDW